MKILMLGGGVIGSVYAARFLRVGHDVTILARGERLAELSGNGLTVENAHSGERDEFAVRAIGAPDPSEHFDLVWVAVQAPQLDSALPLVSGIPGEHDVLFFGNTAGRTGELADTIGGRCLFGFPGVGGVRDGHGVRYVLIRQQKTTLGEPTGSPSERLSALATVFNQAGLPTAISANIEGWLLGHAAFVVPIALALSRVDTDFARLGADRGLLRQMVRATRQAFEALTATGAAEIPGNLRMLYRLPTAFATSYWRRVLTSPDGEFWFGHIRAAPEEIDDMASALRLAVRKTARSTPDLEALFASQQPPP
jgi:2-dehydropantoate 2-reductase